MLAVQQGPSEESIRLFNQAIELHAQNGNKSEEAVSRLAIGNSYQNIGNFELDVANKKLALELYKEIGDLQRQGWVIESLATSYVGAGDFRTALEYLQTALDISLKTKDRTHEARAYRFIGQCYALLGDPTTALDYYEQRGSSPLRPRIRGPSIPPSHGREPHTPPWDDTRTRRRPTNGS